MKKSKGMDNTEIILSSDSSPNLGKKTEVNLNSDKAITTSSSHASSLVDVILDEEKIRAKCSKIGELHCYKTLQ